jgi:hypothetical protein
MASPVNGNQMKPPKPLPAPNQVVHGYEQKGLGTVPVVRRDS